MHDGPREDGRTLADIDPLHVARYEWAARRSGGPAVLDCACGVGYGSLILARALGDASVTGVDVSPSAVRQARDCYGHERVRHLVADMRKLRLREAFDTVVSLETLEHVGNPRVVLERFKEHLRPGGRVVASLPCFPTLHVNRFHEFEVHSFGQAARLFEEAGFRVIETGRQSKPGKKNQEFGLFVLERANGGGNTARG